MQKYGVGLVMKNNNGFSLLEVLIAIFIFAVGILAVGNMQITSIQGNSFANSLTEASTVAQNKIEELMNVSYSDTALVDTDGDGTNQDTNGDGVDDVGTDSSFGLDDMSTATADHSATDGRYTILWNIAVDYPITGTKTVRVFIVWNERGTQKTVSMTTIRTNI